MTISEQKEQLRKTMRRIVRDFCETHDAALYALRARQAVLDAGLVQYADIVLGYLFHGYEADCTGVLYRALLAEKHVGIPRVVPHTGDMDFYLLDGTLPFGDQIEKGSFGISEPVTSLQRLPFDETLAKKKVLMLVPGLAFTADGKRLGRGKGFYDRAIARLVATGADVVLAGFCFPCQVLADVPTDGHDWQVHRVFTA